MASIHTATDMQLLHENLHCYITNRGFLNTPWGNHLTIHTCYSLLSSIKGVLYSSLLTTLICTLQLHNIDSDGFAHCTIQECKPLLELINTKQARRKLFIIMVSCIWLPGSCPWFWWPVSPQCPCLVPTPSMQLCLDMEQVSVWYPSWDWSRIK